MNHETYLQHLKLQYEKYVKGNNQEFMGKAVASYKEALGLNPQNEGLRLRLAYAYEQMRYYEQANTSFSTSLCYRFYECLGRLLRKTESRFVKNQKYWTLHNSSSNKCDFRL